jgi:hypothetical protein
LWIEYQYRRTQAVQYLRGAFLVQHWLSFHGLNQCKNQTNSRLPFSLQATRKLNLSNQLANGTTEPTA